jgi:GNAT superfamily N-acetyltransferase
MKETRTVMICIREAREEDVGQIREIFLAVYGADYPHHEVYDELWLKRSIFTDDTLILVAVDSHTGRVIGTASVLFDFGAHSDLIGEFGRLAVHPDYRRMQVGKLLMEKRLQLIQNRLHVGLAVARTVHPYAQRISLGEGFIATGFLPLKHFFRHRESFALLVRYFGDALSLRRNHPRIIPEVYPLANLVMNQPPLTPDFIADEDSPPYPAGGEYTLEQLQAEGYPALLRIERGRVRNREIFGPMRLDYGFFKLQARQTQYFLARAGGEIAGAVGYTMDPVEHTVHVFELIALADDVVRFLLTELERKCREDLGIEYIEIDVSAYAPRMQRTLLELNFLPVAYVPAMVFYQVERLDIVKMVRLNKLQDLGPLALAEPVQAVADVVMRGFTTCVIAPRMALAIKEIPLFAGMTTEQATRLAGVCTVREVRTGDRLFAEGDAADRLYLVLQGCVSISCGLPSVRVGVVRTGETCGEVSLLSAKPHSATATAEDDVEAAELLQRDLADLIRRRPDVGVIIYRNLAIGLGDKLLRSGMPRRDVDPAPVTEVPPVSAVASGTE